MINFASLSSTALGYKQHPLSAQAKLSRNTRVSTEIACPVKHAVEWERGRISRMLTCSCCSTEIPEHKQKMLAVYTCPLDRRRYTPDLMLNKPLVPSANYPKQQVSHLFPSFIGKKGYLPRYIKHLT